jgi:DNA-binding beta-propeller fold protein YncE
VRGPGKLQLPLSLATNAAGRVYIADAATNDINKFDAQGRPLLSFIDERPKRITGIAVDRGGAIYLADYGATACVSSSPTAPGCAKCVALRPGRFAARAESFWC